MLQFNEVCKLPVAQITVLTTAFRLLILVQCAVGHEGGLSTQSGSIKRKLLASARVRKHCVLGVTHVVTQAPLLSK